MLVGQFVFIYESRMHARGMKDHASLFSQPDEKLERLSFGRTVNRGAACFAHRFALLVLEYRVKHEDTILFKYRWGDYGT